jgi:hypothetical protein
VRSAGIEEYLPRKPLHDKLRKHGLLFNQADSSESNL